MKKYILLLSLIFISSLIPLLLDAQTKEPKAIRYCHHATHDHEIRPLTPEQIQARDASIGRSDTFDLLHINITLEIIDFSSQTINGFTEITFTPKIDDVTVLPLDLEDFTVDSVLINNQNVSYTYNDLLLNVDLGGPMTSNDTALVKVYYNGHPTPDPTGFGGLVFENGYAYNLGIGLGSNPYNYGRGWFACFDNFVERSTYEFNIMTTNNRRAYCTGTFLGATAMGGDTIMRSYYMGQLIPTYLAGVAVSTYEQVDYTHDSAYGPIPMQLVARGGDTSDMKITFEDLGTAVDAIEEWYGPYQWERVGYVATTNGAMEHPTNIAYPTFVAFGGNTTGHKRLMSHELAHCWWGDIVTLSGPENMWIKEGNAEYGAHLFFLHDEGEESFTTVVKNNFLNVLKTAHYDDDDYLPLSGLPYEYTYGTHTYNKGASMIHNMRGYLGDELFEAGQKSVLETFAYSAIDAETYRDQLTLATGVDMTSFFQDWIYSPGYAGYEFNSIDVSPANNGYDVSMTIQQKLRGAPDFHTNTPLDVTCVDADYNQHTQQIMVSGEFTDVTINVPFEPITTFLNGSHKLNMANLGNEFMFTEPDNHNFSAADLEVFVEELTEDTWMRAEHCWIAPDPVQNPQTPDTRISNTHYWKVFGDFPEGFLARGVFNYRGPAIPELDLDLVSNGEDSIQLVYRRDASEEWRLFEPATKVIFLPTDGEGFIRADSLIPGEYAFGNGVFSPMVSTNEVALKAEVDVYPNPTADLVTINASLSRPVDLQLSLSDASGRLIRNESVGTQSGNWTHNIHLGKHPNGIYLLEIKDKKGNLISQKKLIRSAP